MAYLNVIPAAQIPLPNLRGLGAPRLVTPRGMGAYGLGQLSAASYPSCAAYLAANLAALPPVSTAAMLLNTGSPSGAVLNSLFIQSLPSSPEETAQAIVQQLAAEYCGYSADQVVFGGTLAADCADQGAAAANAAYPAWLAYYQALPSSVWTSGTVSAQVANPQVFAASPAPASTSTSSNSNLGQQVIVQSGTDQPLPVTTPASTAPVSLPAPTPVTTPAQTSAAQPASSTLELPDWLTNDVSLGGFNVPVWGLIAAGIGVILLMPKK